jgi:hypothetical protein
VVLKIIGLDNKNYRLLKPNLEKEIDPAKSSFRVKKNRVTISLHKADKNNTWMNLTAKNPLKGSKPDTSDPAAGIMDMMKVRPNSMCLWRNVKLTALVL